MNADSRLISVADMTAGDTFLLGKTMGGRHTLVGWSPDDRWMLNGHTIIGGMSGTGKTRLMKQLIRWLSKQRKTMKVIDFQGDMRVAGETVFEVRARYDKDSPHYSISPFEFDKDTKNGGPTVHAELLVEIFKKSLFPSIGPIQKQLFKQLVTDTYTMAGITEDTKTWSNELPTILDFKKLHQDLMRTLGNNHLWHINKQIQKILDQRELMQEDRDKALEKIESAMGEINGVFHQLKNYVKQDVDGDYGEWGGTVEIDLEPYSSKRAISQLESLSPYIKEMASMSIFLGERVPLETPGHVRFDISGLTNSAKPSQAIFFSELVMQAEFRRVKLRGEYEEYAGKVPGWRFDTAIIIDESKLVLPVGKEKENPYHIAHRINTEGRKYGLISVSATQSFGHYSDDILQNAGAKIILLCDGKEHKKLKSSFTKLNDSLLQKIEIFGTALVDTGKGFEVTVMPWADKEALGIKEPAAVV